MKGFIYLFLAVAGVAITAWRKAKGRRQLQLLESGGLCLHCRSTSVTPGKKGVVCGACGQTTSWALIRQPSLTDEEVARMNTPDRDSGFFD